MPGTEPPTAVTAGGKEAVNCIPRTRSWIARLTLGRDENGKQVRERFIGKTRVGGCVAHGRCPSFT